MKCNRTGLTTSNQPAAAKQETEVTTRARYDDLASLSHRIRTPLTAVLGFLELVDDECPLLCEFSSGLRREYLDTIANNGRQLLRILDEIACAPQAETLAPEFRDANC